MVLLKTWDEIRTESLAQLPPFPTKTSHPTVLTSLSSEDQRPVGTDHLPIPHFISILTLLFLISPNVILPSPQFENYN